MSNRFSKLRFFAEHIPEARNYINCVFQIDLLIDRQDNSINLCEMKFYESEFAFEKSYAEKLMERIAQFKTISKTRKQVFLTFISTFGIKQNPNSLGLVHHDIKMDALFGD